MFTGALNAVLCGMSRMFIPLICMKTLLISCDVLHSGYGFYVGTCEAIFLIGHKFGICTVNIFMGVSMDRWHEVWEWSGLLLHMVEFLLKHVVGVIQWCFAGTIGCFTLKAYFHSEFVDHVSTVFLLYKYCINKNRSMEVDWEYESSAPTCKLWLLVCFQSLTGIKVPPQILMCICWPCFGALL